LLESKVAKPVKIGIPTHPGNYEGYDSIAVLCEYHYERFEEMYQPRWHDKLGDVQDLIRMSSGTGTSNLNSLGSIFYSEDPGSIHS
jgi:hypothetical protein